MLTRFFRFFAFISLAFTLLSAPLHAEDKNAAIIKIAEDYIAAYSTFDVDVIEPFIADDAIFSDPTSKDQNASGGQFMFVGKKAILKGLGEYAAQYKSFTLVYDVERRYVANNVVVFVAQLTYTVIALDDQVYTDTAPIVTAITVKDSKVKQHIDLYDYDGNAVDFE